MALLMANSQPLDTSGLFHKGPSMFTCLLWRSMYSQMVPTTLLCPLCQACLDHNETSPEGIQVPRLLLWKASIYFLREWYKTQRGDRQNATLEGKGGVAWLRDDITELSIQLVRLHKRCFVLHEIKVPLKQMQKWNLKSHNLHKKQDTTHSLLQLLQVSSLRMKTEQSASEVEADAMQTKPCDAARLFFSPLGVFYKWHNLTSRCCYSRNRCLKETRTDI